MDSSEKGRPTQSAGEATGQGTKAARASTPAGGDAALTVVGPLTDTFGPRPAAHRGVFRAPRFEGHHRDESPSLKEGHAVQHFLQRCLLAGTVLAVGLLPATAMSASGPTQPGCAAATAVYRQMQGAPQREPTGLAAYYEIGMGTGTYGPGPGVPVPWSRVVGWVHAHSTIAIAGCIVTEGWSFVALRVQGGYAYVQLTPTDQISKLYLSSRPLVWD